MAPEITPKRRLMRRDAEDAVERVLGRRLANISPEERVGLRSVTGKSIDEYVGDGIKERRANKGRLNSEFWMRLDRGFPSLNDDPLQGIEWTRVARLRMLSCSLP